MKPHKFNKKWSQRTTLIQAFKGRPKTMLEVARITGIERAYICYRLADLTDKGIINLEGFGLCPISRHRAGFYKTQEND